MLETSGLLGPCEEQNAGLTTILSGQSSCSTSPLPIRRNPSLSIHHSTAKLKHSSHQANFMSRLDEKITTPGPLTRSLNQQWDQFHLMVKAAAQMTLGPKKRVHLDWFNENEAISQLLNEKQKVFLPPQGKSASNTSSTSPKPNARQIVEEKAEKIQLYADTKNSKMFFQHHQGSVWTIFAKHYHFPVNEGHTAEGEANY